MKTEAVHTSDPQCAAAAAAHPFDSKCAGACDVVGVPAPIVRLSAALAKTKMLPYGLQNPVTRKEIWRHLVVMLQERGYRWIFDRPPPTDTEELLPAKSGSLGHFHMHAVDERGLPDGRFREPVYVLFCFRAGDPTLRGLLYKSRHVIVVADVPTSKAKTAILTEPLQAPPTIPNASALPTTGAEATIGAISVRDNTTSHPTAPNAAGVERTNSVGAATGVSGVTGTGNLGAAATDSVTEARLWSLGAVGTTGAPPEISGTARDPSPGAYKFEEVFVEMFQWVACAFSLPNHRYTETVKLDGPTQPAELAGVFDTFETSGDVMKFPKMYKTDPLALYHQYAPGDVCRATRLSTSAGQSVAYRTIIPPPAA